MNLQDIYFLNNSLGQWLVSTIWVAGALLVGFIIDRGIERILEPILLRDSPLNKVISDLIQSTLFITFFLLGLGQARKTLTLSNTTETLIQAFWPVVVGFIFVWFFTHFFRWLTPNSIVQKIILNRLTPLLATIFAIFWLARFWVTRPLTCAPSCAAQSVLNADLRGLILRDANLVDSNLRGADLSDADLTGADLSGANLTSATLRNVDLSEAFLIGADLTGADLRGAILEDTNFSGAILNRADLTRLDLTRADLHGITLQQAKLVQASLTGVDLSGANLIQATLTGANMDHVLLNGAHLSGADLSDVSLVGAEVTGALINVATLTGADLHEADLSGTSFIGTNLSSVDLHDSKLVGATLIGSNLSGASFRSADLSGARLLRSEIFNSDARVDSVLFELNELQVANLIVDANLQGVTFDSDTVWPTGKDAFLANLLGSSATNTTETEETEDSLQLEIKPDFTIIGQANSAVLQNSMISLIMGTSLTGTVAFNGTDATTGIQILCADESVLFAVTNRAVRDSERTVCEAQQHTLTEVLVALEAIVPVVSAQNEFVESISAEQAQELLTAERWADIDPLWPSEPLQRYLPDENSPTVELLTRWVYPEADGTIRDAENIRFDNNVLKIADSMSSDLYGVAFVNYATYLQNTNTFRLIEIEEMPLSAETVANGEYVLVQPLNLIVRRQDLLDRTPIADYLNAYLQGVSAVVEPIGYFAVDAELLAKIQTALTQAEDGELTLGNSTLETIAIAADAVVSDTVPISVTETFSPSVTISATLPVTSIVAVGEGAAATLLLTAYGQYIEQTAGISLSVDPVSGGEGLERLCTEKSADIVLLSDLAALNQTTGCAPDALLAIPAGEDALAFIVHPNNTFATDLTQAEATALLFAESWSEVDFNWPETELVKLVADETLLTAFVNTLAQGDPNLALSLRSAELDTAPSFAKLIETVTSNPNAIALVSYARLQPHLDAVNLVEIDKTPPSADTILDGSYPFVRSLFFYTMFDTLAERSFVAEFLTFYLTEIETVTGSANYILPNPNAIERARTRIATIIPTE